MKYLFTLCFSLWCFCYGFSQDTRSSKISPYTALRMKTQATATARSAVPGFVGGMIRISHEPEIAALAYLNVKVGTKAENIWSIKIPLENVARLAELDGIEYIKLDAPVYKKMDSVMYFTNVKQVHQGEQLPMPLYGEGVVIGILDGGFDLTHPAFIDAAGNLRIKRVWNQMDDFGIAPPGYGYGSELNTPSEIFYSEYTSDAESHGTHVAAIASGYDYYNTGISGIAPKSDIVLVEVGEEASSVVDGINYIFNYAKSVGKPAVVNLSLGSHMGPHDGMSVDDQIIDILSEPGYIIVGAVGNEGDIPLHLKHQFIGDTIESFIEFEEGDKEGNGWLNFWGTPNTSFAASLSIYNNLGQEIKKTRYLKSNSQDWIDTTIFVDGDEIYLAAEMEASSPDNGRPNMILYIEDMAPGYYITIKITSVSGIVHGWNVGFGYGAAFADHLPGKSKFRLGKRGDFNSTNGEIGGTSKEIISVGAYTSKTSFQNLEGTNLTGGGPGISGDICDWSSKGPTIDGRIKPEVVAPGSYVVSAINSYDYYYQAYPEELTNEIVHRRNTYHYGVMEGTSMSAPVVAGIIGLWLGANANLDADQIKEIIKNTSIRDGFTGNIGIPGSNTWGWGKINAWEGIKSAAQLVPTNTGITKSSEFLVYPQPSKGLVSIIAEGVGQVAEIIVSNIEGVEVYSEIINFSSEMFIHDLDLSMLKEGMYIVNLKTEIGLMRHKIIITR